MYYALNPDYRICGYRGLPYLLYHRAVDSFSILSKEDADLIGTCDGSTDMPLTDSIKRLCSLKILKSSPEPIPVTDDQRYVYYDNRYFHTVTWAVTSACNLNCRHCFAAKDANRSADRFTMEEAKKLIGEMKACGVHEVDLTGGEPLMHPELDKIIEELSRSDIKIGRIVTNGLLVTDTFLKRLKELKVDPLFTVSFDGLGTHDWLRNAEGIEQKTLDQIDRIVGAGFDVSVQMCLYRGNTDRIWDTLKYFETRGIREMRFMRASEAPRWAEHYLNQTLTFEEYFDVGLNLTERYAAEGGTLGFWLWRLLQYRPCGGRIGIVPTHNTGKCSGKWTACQDAHKNFFIGAAGEAAPCMPVSGFLMMQGVSMGNVKKEPLQKLLSESGLTDWTLLKLEDIYRVNEKCRECQYRDACCGGCRALAYGLTGDLCGNDPMRCTYFFGGFYDRLNGLVKQYS